MVALCHFSKKKKKSCAFFILKISKQVLIKSIEVQTFLLAACKTGILLIVKTSKYYYWYCCNIDYAVYSIIENRIHPKNILLAQIIKKKKNSVLISAVAVFSDLLQ